MAEIERQVALALERMDTGGLHPAVGTCVPFPGCETYDFEAGAEKLSAKYTQKENMALIGAHALLRLDRAMYLQTAASQGFFDTLGALEDLENAKMAQWAAARAHKLESQLNLAQTKSLEELHDFSATEAHLIARIREILDSKIH